MMELDTEIRSELTTELEGFFDDAGMESEAEVVALVLDGDMDEGGDVRVAGVPGAAIAGLAPIVIEWFLALLGAFLEQLQKTSLEEGAKSLVGRVKEWLTGRAAKKKSLRRVDVSERIATIAEIARTLEAAGWPREAVEGAAKDLWERGERAARAVAKQKG
ncbi:hypothetical protein [Sandaracinus amylolyticus]|uniref:hypothetical protein n=1 Tax=Sandaracinus amylolyticus TaxID=927083 RepID=UPI001F44FAA4|nr:hypothetical protein [Sandaracinus amylolyticus]UJR84194.1 Hypothetical protein I5071_62650 [Sandaracinus amylolyticus]